MCIMTPLSQEVNTNTKLKSSHSAEKEKKLAKTLNEYMILINVCMQNNILFLDLYFAIESF